MTAAATSAAYDLVPYDSGPFAHTHPDRLATVATLFGLEPTGVGRCRVLEIGCPAGGNLIPMALGLPQKHILGHRLFGAADQRLSEGYNGTGAQEC